MTRAYLLLLLFPLAAPAADGDPVLLARGKGHVIQVVPPTPFPAKKGAGASAFSVAILHLDTTTGEMQRLLSGGAGSSTGPPMGMQWVSYRVAFIVGVLADGERTYAVTRETVSGSHGLPPPLSAFPRGTYHLRVFRNRDGKAIWHQPFHEGEFPKAPLTESAGVGPLSLARGEVRCFGWRFTFRGDELVEARRPGGVVPAARDPGPRDAPVLIARGKGGFFHLVPRAPPPPPPPGLRDDIWGRLGHFGGWGPPTSSLVYTHTDTGTTKRLLAGGEWASPLGPMAVARVRYRQARLIGALADDERVYALTWGAETTAEADPRSEPRRLYPAGTYTLHAYRRADGERLLERAFTEGDLPPHPLAEQAHAGPLAKAPGGVRCFGVTFTFAGDRLKAARYEKPKDSKKDG